MGSEKKIPVEELSENRRQEILENLSKFANKNIKLNFGSGYCRIPGYTRIDIDETIDSDEHWDIAKLDNYKSNYAEEIYIAHTLEHAFQKDLFSILRSFFRILIDLGMLIIIVPDALRISEDFADSKIDYWMYERLLIGSNPHATKYMLHLNLFCEDKLRRFLYITGFNGIVRQETDNKYELKMIGRKITC